MLVTICLSGCSLSLSGPAPNRPRTEIPRCDTGKGAVVIDGVWTGLLTVSSLAAFSEEESGVGLASLAIGALFLGSAIKGNRAVDECRRAFADHRMIPPPLDVDDQPLAVSPRPRRTLAPAPTPAVAAPARPEDAIQEPATPQAAPAKPASPAEPPDDEWDQFWKEVP